MATYSFLQVQVGFAGPGAAFSLGSGSGSAQEGISIESVEDKNEMLIGADGEGMHSLKATKAVTVTIRQLKTSPANSLLMLAFNYQTSNALFHGKNVITVRDSARGDLHLINQAAFKKQPAINYASVGDIVEWTFDGIDCTSLLGIGTPEA